MPDHAWTALPPSHPLADLPPITPERIAYLLEQGVVLAHLDILREIEDRDSAPVRLRSHRRSDGTWELIVTHVPPDFR